MLAVQLTWRAGFARWVGMLAWQAGCAASFASIQRCWLLDFLPQIFLSYLILSYSISFVLGSLVDIDEFSEFLF